MNDGNMINLKINGIDCHVLRQALPSWKPPTRAGIDIPTLCYLKEINEIGACRICVVEVKGRQETWWPACVYPVSEGMEVSDQYAETDRIAAQRTTWSCFCPSTTRPACPASEADTVSCRNCAGNLGVEDRRPFRRRE